MLEVYRDDQYQVAPKTIAVCLYRWIFTSGHDKRTVRNRNFISSPLREIDVAKHHGVTLTEPSRLSNKHDSDTTLVPPNDSEVVRKENYNEGIAMSVNSKPHEPDIREWADKDHKGIASYNASMGYPVRWNRKEGLDPKITIVCPTPWTTIDPYDFHIQKVQYKDHEIACSLRSFSQKHSGYFAKFTIFTIPTITEKLMAGWARSGLSLHFGLIVAHELEILSWPLQRFILDKTSTALKLYEQTNFPLPENPQVLCNCFQIWREEPLKFSLKFGMPYLNLAGHTTTNRRNTQAFLEYLREIFKKSASENGKASNSSNEWQNDTMGAMGPMDRKRVDNDLGRIFAHKECLLPQEKLNTMAKHSRPE